MVYSSAAAYIFLFLKLILTNYFLILLVKAFQILKRIFYGNLILQSQGDKISFVGSGIIAYASIKYALYVLFGIVFFNDIGVLIRDISAFFLFVSYRKTASFSRNFIP